MDSVFGKGKRNPLSLLPRDIQLSLFLALHAEFITRSWRDSVRIHTNFLRMRTMSNCNGQVKIRLGNRRLLKPLLSLDPYPLDRWNVNNSVKGERGGGE